MVHMVEIREGHAKKTADNAGKEFAVAYIFHY